MERLQHERFHGHHCGPDQFSFSQPIRDKMYFAEQQKCLTASIEVAKIGTVLGVFYRHRHISSKTSSFGGTSAQPSGVALFFALMLRSNIRTASRNNHPSIHELKNAPAAVPAAGGHKGGFGILRLRFVRQCLSNSSSPVSRHCTGIIRTSGTWFRPSERIPAS
jgi:hypothetical protein